jgi:hypothetical protein
LGEKRKPWGIRWTDKEGGFTPGFETKAEAEGYIRKTSRPGKSQRDKVNGCLPKETKRSKVAYV